MAQCFAANFVLRVSGVLPEFLQGKVPAMMGCESGVLSPNQDDPEEPDISSGVKKRNRRSFGGKTPNRGLVVRDKSVPQR